MINVSSNVIRFQVNSCMMMQKTTQTQSSLLQSFCPWSQCPPSFSLWSSIFRILLRNALFCTSLSVGTKSSSELSPLTNCTETLRKSKHWSLHFRWFSSSRFVKNFTPKESSLSLSDLFVSFCAPFKHKKRGKPPKDDVQTSSFGINERTMT
jgi:hypothetical protein